MKNQKIFEIENAITAAIGSTKNWPLIKHLRKNKALTLIVTNPIREDMAKPETFAAYERELQSVTNELNAMAQPEKIAALKALREKHPTAHDDALAWSASTAAALDDVTEIEFFSADSSLARKGNEVVIDSALYDLFCEVGIFAESD